MKFHQVVLNVGVDESPPTRGRGLKHHMACHLTEQSVVAPCAGDVD